MNKILNQQLAIDYCCFEDEVSDGANHFMLHHFLPGRRRFQEGDECFLKIAVINGKLLVGLLKNEILKRGILPYYGTSLSHIASQRVALGAGFAPAWVELTVRRN